MGFHSYRNIGFSFVDAETTCRKWREKFTGFTGKGTCECITVTETDEGFELTYLGSRYRLHKKNGVLEKKIDEIWTEKLQMNEALTVYHYLGDEKNPVHTCGEWVPENVLDPVKIRTSDRMNPLFVSFAKEYTGRIKELENKCKMVGGVYEASSGDTSWIFYPFPEIPVKLVFWDADEDFPAQVKIYVKENATDYVHYEAVSFIIADICFLINST